MSRFEWERLLNAKRFSFSGDTEYTDSPTDDDVFNKDAERILTSSSFRRLQGKTQVYPFPQSDFVRNRLTHTNEVAQIGKTIARLIAKNAGLTPQVSRDFEQIAFNGCLLHDIGNPPFGHSGESSIREYFLAKGDDLPLVLFAMNEKEYENDLVFFDGNAHGFRVATRLAGWKENGGLRLSAATLSTMVKYAFGSTSPAAAKGKFGFMSTESYFANAIFSHCDLMHGNVMYRNPVSLVVEAADDIAYLTSDVQDGHRYGDIPYEIAKTVLFNLSTPAEKIQLSSVDKGDRDRHENVISYLRTAAVSYMIKAASEILSENIFSPGTLLKGDEKFEIWSGSHVPHEFSKIGRAEEQIRDISNELLYKGKKKIAQQVAGGRIIKFVLSMQLKALWEIYSALYDLLEKHPKIVDKIQSRMTLSPSVENYTMKLINFVDKFVSRESAQIFWGMPADAQDIMQHILIEVKNNKLLKEDPNICYRIIQISLDFVAGTTDRYLSDYSRQWSGPFIN